MASLLDSVRVVELRNEMAIPTLKNCKLVKNGRLLTGNIIPELSGKVLVRVFSILLKL